VANHRSSANTDEYLTHSENRSSDTLKPANKKESLEKKEKILNTTEPEDMRQFATGAQRSKDADDVRYDLIPQKSLHRIAAVLKTGADRYGAHNWRRGLPIAGCLNHALRHIYLFLEGDKELDQDGKECDHLANASCNLLFVLHYLSEGHEYNPTDA